jgi:hypothetical protein
MTDVIERYLQTWNETDPQRRRAALAEIFTDGAQYVDPMAEATGQDEIDATIAAVQQMFPEHTFSLAGPVDSHHRQARFRWQLGTTGAEPTVIGFDVATFDEAGRIESVLGFLDKVPAS